MMFVGEDGDEGMPGAPGVHGATGAEGAAGAAGATGVQGAAVFLVAQDEEGEQLIFPPPLPPRWTRVRLITSQNVTNSITLTSSVLAFNMLASRNYVFKMVAFFDTTAAGDMKYQFTGPASPTMVRLICYDKPPAATAITAGMLTAFSSVRTVVSASTIGGSVHVEGMVQNGANAGDITFQFAQNTQTNDAGVTLLVGSYLEYTAIN
jgi:Collagen triple helix repeat (20 copies)